MNWRDGQRAMMAGFAMLVLLPLLMAGFAFTHEAGAAARVVNLSDRNRVGKLRVTLNESETIRISIPFSEIVVGDPETADVSPLTDRTLYVLGRKLGTTNVTLFDTNKQVAAVIDIEVSHNLSGLKQALKGSVPGGSAIRVRSINGRVLLDGQVPSAVAAEKAMRIAKDFAGEDVTNSLSIAANQQVNLEVRFVEVNRTAGKELGINWNLSRNNDGVRTGSGVFNLEPRPPIAGLGALSNTLPFGTIVAGFLNNGVSPDLLITALEQRRLARRLAEPNLTALSGEPASFHAGGEFPIPIAQEDNKVTVEFKEFGVRLKFTPVVLDDGLINLKIEPEVSELDAANSIQLTQDGVRIPGLSVRRASTSVELRDGQSFAIAGLLQTVNQKTADQVPWLGDVPVLGTLFRSSSFQKRESDLVIIVTPRLARPVGAGQVLATPLDNPISSNEPEFFLFGKQEIPRRELDRKFKGKYGHIIDLPKGYSGAPPDK
jgi:pilus assembly protein CpaC